MAHLWVRDEDGWGAQRLSDAGIDLAGPLTRQANASEHPATPAHAARLIRTYVASAQTWALVASPSSTLRVNGRTPPAGLCVLDDRDEIRCGAEKLYFSTETLASVEPFPGSDRPVFCGRCRQLIEPDSPSVRCPSCGVWYNQSVDLPCWTYAEKMHILRSGHRSRRGFLVDSGGSMTPTNSHHIVVAGAGGNTGSHLLPHLARMANVARLTLVDPDIYEQSNLPVQNIESHDLGQAKVEAQAFKLRRINPSLELIALQQRVEDVPRGQLQSDLMLSCLDSKVSRQYLNETAWRLSTPWFDCGVLGSQNLVRVNAYIPAQDAPCIECGWGHDEYATLEQEYLCGASGRTFPTMASSALGALAASMIVIEVAKFLRDEPAAPLAGRQLVFDAEHHIVQVTALRRNPWCRFDHRSWMVEPWKCRLETTTVSHALAELGSLRVEGHRFVAELICPGCSRRIVGLRLNRPLARCPECNRRMVTAGFGALERLDSTSVNGSSHLTLAQIGLLPGDIVSCGTRHRRIVEAA
jgi:molybdopterin/thiamine biosynthesis adenylyltransferase